MPIQSAPVAVILFFVTIGISLYTMYRNPRLYYKLSLSPYKVVHNKEYFRIITHGFVHADMMHLIFNMLTFFFFAFAFERTVGSMDFFLIYFISLVAATITTIKKYKSNPNYRSVGASGAISGILLGAILYNPQATIYVFFAIPIPAPLFAVLYIAYTYFASKQSADMINHEAHLWGAIAGLATTILFEPAVVPYFLENLF